MPWLCSLSARVGPPAARPLCSLERVGPPAGRAALMLAGRRARRQAGFRFAFGHACSPARRARERCSHGPHRAQIPRTPLPGRPADVASPTSSPTEPRVTATERDSMKGFRTFLLRGNVIDLAVAVVMGVAFNNIVQAIVKYLITPLITAATGKTNFAGLTFTVGKTTISYGQVINAVIAFIIIAAVVYFLLVAPMSKIISYSQRNKEAAERECPECLSVIPMKATRCKFCTAVVQPPAPPAVPASSR